MFSTGFDVLTTNTSPLDPVQLWLKVQCRKSKSFLLFTCHLNCKYRPWGLINDMQISIYNRKHWHALSNSLHFVRHEGDWRPTHPPQRVSRVPDYLFMYSIQSVLGLSQVRLIPRIPYYNVMNNNTQG